MKNKKLTIVLCLMIIFSLFGNTLTVDAATPKLNYTKATICVKQKITLKLSGTSKKVKWYTTNSKIATVNSKGVVQGKKYGTTTVYTKVGKKTLKCKITVKSHRVPNEWSIIRKPTYANTGLKGRICVRCRSVENKTIPKKVLKQLGLPIKNVRKSDITSSFGARISPITNKKEFHSGIDLAHEKGTKIYAAKSGTVTFAGYNQIYGKCIVINHGDGLFTLYGQCDTLKVKKDTKVKSGQYIATIGSTGMATGPHLHFSVRIGNDYINPVPLLW